MDMATEILKACDFLDNCAKESGDSEKAADSANMREWHGGRKAAFRQAATHVREMTKVLQANCGKETQ